MKKLISLLLLVLLFATNVHAQSGTPCLKYTFAGLAGTVQTVKGTPAIICGYQILNTTAAVCYLQIFDTSGAVILGTTVPDQSLGWPASAAANVPSALPGIQFSNGIKVAGTTTRAGAVGCALDVNIWYK